MWALAARRMDVNKLQAELDEVFGNYFEVSKMLQNDISFLYEHQDDSESWRRNFIRAVIPLIEGYCHSFREAAKIYLATGGPLNEKQSQAVLEERANSAEERIKLNIKTAHIVLVDEATSTNFGDGNWELAKEAIAKRGALMHPQSKEDLHLGNEKWSRIYQGIQWLCEQVFGIYSTLHERIINCS